MSTILITGAFGYLGGRISRFLADDTSLCLRLASRIARPSPNWLKNGKTVKFSLGGGEPTPSCDGVDSIIHLAAINENECQANPIAACSVNCLGTLQLLEEAKKSGVKRFVYLSTARVYGGTLTGTVTEETTCRPTHPYGISHKGAEEYVLAAHDQRQLTGLTIRLANAFGAPLDPNVDRWTLLANDLCRQAVRSRKMVLRSSGIQLRSFVTLGDVASAAKHCLSMPASACGDGVFNLSSGTSSSVWEITQLIAKRCRAVLGYEPEILRPAQTPGETASPLDFRIDKIKATGFVPAGSFADEIDATLRLCAESFRT